jgi:hypothetical protein
MRVNGIEKGSAQAFLQLLFPLLTPLKPSHNGLRPQEWGTGDYRRSCALDFLLGYGDNGSALCGLLALSVSSHEDPGGGARH